MARHAVVDLSIVFDSPPCELDDDRLPPADLDRLTSILLEFGYVQSEEASEVRKLQDLRHMYEPYLYALGDYLGLDVPSWVPKGTQADNWQTNPWQTIDPAPQGVVKDRHKHRHF
jgi:hypothetical protein